MCMCYSWKCREIRGVGIKTDKHNTCYKEQQQTTYHCHYSGSLFSHHNSILSKILSHLHLLCMVGLFLLHVWCSALKPRAYAWYVCHSEQVYGEHRGQG